ncbi:MAG TPA: HD domain-containing phosphohydrolase [Thermoleophilia bacterium]
MDEETIKSAGILVVDDEEPIVRLMRRVLDSGGFPRHWGTSDPRQVVELIEEFHPDLMILDIRMPHMDGFEVMEQVAPLIPPGEYFPILVLTSFPSVETEQRALAAGAKDFLIKPADPNQVLARVRNLLTTRMAYRELVHSNDLLEKRVRERTADLESAQLEILERLARATEYRDDETGQHTKRVGRMSRLIAIEMGMASKQVELIGRVAPLHDVGKISIPDGILNKRGSLCSDELDWIKRHTTVGAELLSRGYSELVKTAEIIALSHHERWDGSGYPQGLQGATIPLMARIVAIADSFDALTHDRPYNRRRPVREALVEIERERGRQFDPEIVDAFMRVQQLEASRNDRTGRAREEEPEVEPEVLATVTSLLERRLGAISAFPAGSAARNRGDTIL